MRMFCAFQCAVLTRSLQYKVALIPNFVRFSSPRWSRPIRPTLAAGVWQGSEARRAGRAGLGCTRRREARNGCPRHSARASMYLECIYVFAFSWNGLGYNIGVVKRHANFVKMHEKYLITSLLVN